MPLIDQLYFLGILKSCEQQYVRRLLMPLRHDSAHLFLNLQLNQLRHQSQDLAIPQTLRHQAFFQVNHLIVPHPFRQKLRHPFLSPTIPLMQNVVLV